jgi:type I restriction enzyme S subunit
MLKKYEDYKETQISYLGSLPSHWNILPLRSILFERKEKNIGKKNNEILSVMANRGVILYSEKGNVGNKASDNIERYNVVYEDDIVLNCMNVIIGSVGRSPYNGVLSPVYYVLVNRNTQTYNTRYYDYVFKLKPLQSELKKYGKGILAHRMRISMDSLKSLNLPCPPIEEQNQVVKYLDWKLSKINKLIRAKKKQIALLNEQKQVIINNAVTKGLDPNVPMKDSGIEWIGQVPSHWKIYRNKNIFSLRKETVGESSKDYTLLSLTTNGIIPRDIESGKGKFPSDFSTYQKVYSGDFVFCLFDIDETPRTVGLSSYEGMITGAYTVMTPKNADSLFIYYYYLSLDNKKALKPLYTGLRKVINTDVFLRSKIVLPDINEQKQIVEYIENKINLINKAISVIQSEISLLTEYRTRLISDVVTGKVDVRGIEIPEYEADSDDLIEDELEGENAMDDEAEEAEVE